MRYSTLYYQNQIGFVLDEFSRLQAGVNVLSTCQEGEAERSGVGGEVYFQLMMGLMDVTTF